MYTYIYNYIVIMELVMIKNTGFLYFSYKRYYTEIKNYKTHIFICYSHLVYQLNKIIIFHDYLPIISFHNTSFRISSYRLPCHITGHKSKRLETHLCPYLWVTMNSEKDHDRFWLKKIDIHHRRNHICSKTKGALAPRCSIVMTSVNRHGNSLSAAPTPCDRVKFNPPRQKIHQIKELALRNI